METIVKVVMVLTLATAAAAAGIEPNEYRCTFDSPVSAPQYSNTVPPVALTHIFCGEIVKKGSSVKANGFHSRFLVNQPEVGPTSARVLDDDATWCAAKWMDMKDCTCCFYSDGIEVYDDDLKRYIEKKHKNSKFFPDKLKPNDVVKIALEVFKKKMKNKMPKGNSDACLPEVEISGCDSPTAVMIFTDGEHISTVFPVDKC